MGNCNICAVDTCHKFIGLNNNCRNYLPLAPFKRSVLEHLAGKNATTVAKLLTMADIKFDETNTYPFFRLVY